ncbi:MAG TPA: response regulator transcription factor [Lapillicoccus sp.]|nr:response regulator transcription factor [Lapillicoccus sp.]
MGLVADAEPVRVVLVDDHPVVRAGLRALLEGRPDDVVVVGEAVDAASAGSTVLATRPDVVLMDLNLGAGPGGIEAIRELAAAPNPPRVLVLTTYQTEADVLAALDAGASGYLLKDAPPDELFRAVRATARGETVLSPAVAAMMVRRASSPGPVMTEREVEVLGLLAEGLGNKEMARRLLVSEATVKSHLTHVYAKLGVDSRAGAVAKAIEQRIIRPS